MTRTGQEHGPWTACPGPYRHPRLGLPARGRAHVAFLAVLGARRAARQHQRLAGRAALRPRDDRGAARGLEGAGAGAARGPAGRRGGHRTVRPSTAPSGATARPPPYGWPRSWPRPRRRRRRPRRPTKIPRGINERRLREKKQRARDEAGPHRPRLVGPDGHLRPPRPGPRPGPGRLAPDLDPPPRPRTSPPTPRRRDRPQPTCVRQPKCR